MKTKYTAHRTAKIDNLQDCVGQIRMINRTGDDLAWRNFMKTVHGGFVALRKIMPDGSLREMCLGRERNWF